MEHQTTQPTNLEIVELSPIQIVRSDSQEYFQGYAVRYYDGTKATVYKDGPVEERVARGSFSDILRSGADIELWWNHNKDMQLASVASQDLFLTEDAQGVKYLAPYDAANPVHQYVRKAIEKKWAKGASFRAQGETKMSREGGTFIRTITKVHKLTEFSVVKNPAYRSSTAEIVRSEIAEFEKDEERRLKTQKAIEAIKNL